MGIAHLHRGYFLLMLGVIVLGPTPSAASWDPFFRGAQAFDVGVWSPTSTYRGSAPHQLTTGDLNGDGRPDLVVANGNDSLQYTGKSISVLLHSPDPSARSAYPSKASYPALNGPLQVELADMNLDGHLDAVVRSVEDSVCVMLGTGSGSFGPPVHKAALGLRGHNYFRGMVLADVNQDGRPDVLASGQDHLPTPYACVTVLLGTGGGLLGPPALYRTNLVAGSETEGVAVGDFTGDGIVDVIAAGIGGETNGHATLLQGDGFGAFTYVNWILLTGEEIYRVAAKDLNGDTIPDLVLGGTDGTYVMVTTGNGTFSASGQLAEPNGSSEWVEVGDVNLDGHPDLVIGGVGMDHVSVRFGSQSGNFTTPFTYPLPHAWCEDFRLVDVNMNGRLDLVYGSLGARTHMVSVLLDDGFLGFQSIASSVPFVGPVRHPAVADFDRNGKLDVAVAGSGRIEVGVGNGDGTFTGLVGGAVTSPGAVVTGDWNRDGRADLAFQTGGTSINGWSGNGDGTFSFGSFSISGRTLHRRSVSDMNRDGRSDFIVTSGATVQVETRNPDGTYFENPAQSAGSTIQSLALGDWNRDGATDVALATLQGAVLCLGNGDGTLGPRVGVTGSWRSYADLCAGDFNRDGKLDLAMIETLAGQSGLRGIDIALGNGSGGFGAGPSIPTLEQNGLRIESWDVNQDGYPDLVASGIADHTGDFWETEDVRVSSVELHLGNGTGQFGPPQAYSLEVTEGAADKLMAPLFAVGDVNRDDLPDVLFPGYRRDLLLPGPFRSLLATPPDFGNALGARADYAMSSGTSRVAVGDLNRDGIPDVATSSTANPVTVRLGTPQGTLGPATTVSQSLAAQHIGLADVNRDGRLDLLLARAGLGAPDLVTCMLGNGDGTFGPRLDNGLIDIMTFAVGDMNRDGKPDLVVGKIDPGLSSVRVLLGNGDGTFAAQPLAILPTNKMDDIELGDVNRDGILDVVCAAGGVYVLNGTGSGTLAPSQPVDLGSSSFRTLCLADFDRDGYVDLAAADQTFRVVVASGSGSPPFATSLTSGTPENVKDLQVGCTERDGRLFLYLATTGSKVVLMQPGVSPVTFLTAGTYDTGTDAEALALGDLNRDGLIDVFTANSGAGTVSVFALSSTVVTAVDEMPAPVARARLDQNAPNPFNPETTIRFAVPSAGRVLLSIHDVHGRLVSKLVDGHLPPGEHAVRWNGRAGSGTPAASGVYFYKLETEAGYGASKRMVLLK